MIFRIAGSLFGGGGLLSIFFLFFVNYIVKMVFKKVGSVLVFLSIFFVFLGLFELYLLIGTASAIKFVFFIFSINLVFSAWMVIFSFNPVYSVLFLVLTFFNGSGLLFFLGLDFLAFMLLIVYIGAIAVLFLFVVMMLNIKVFQFFFSSFHYLASGSAVLFLFFFIFFDLFFNFTNLNIFVSTNSFSWFRIFSYVPNIELFGYLVYGPYVFHLVLSLLILLIAVVGAISLTASYNFEVRKQNVYSQTFRYRDKAWQSTVHVTVVDKNMVFEDFIKLPPEYYLE